MQRLFQYGTMILLVSGLCLTGCGGPEPPKPLAKPPQKNEPAKKPTVAAAKEKQAPAAPATKIDPKDIIDFASIKAFPEMKFSTSKGIYGKDPAFAKKVLGGPVATDQNGKPIHVGWAGVTPATFEIELPKKLDKPPVLTTVIVTDRGGEWAIDDYEVSVKDRKGEWVTPPGIKKYKRDYGSNNRGKVFGHTIEFPSIVAESVRLTFPKGCKARPQEAHIEKINVWGYYPN